MKTLSKEEKEIIKLIQEKKITDIYSYVKYYNLGTEVQYFEEDIQKAFDEKYGDKTFIISKTRDNFINKKHIVEELPDNQYRVKPYLSYDNGCPDWDAIYYNHGQIQHSYHLIEPTYICENIEKILDFISVWQFLESERLIIDLPKSCEEQDMGLFLRKKFETPDTKEFPDKVEHTFELQVDAREFMDWRFELDVHNFEICLPYLQKQIQPTLGLDTFIEKDFKTKADLNERRNFIIALAGVIVAIITSTVSIFISIFDNGNAEELIKINNSLQEIREELELPEETTEAPLPTEETDSLEQITPIEETTTISPQQ